MSDVDDDVRAMKVVDLRAALTALGLDTKGLKAVLVERLMEARYYHTTSCDVAFIVRRDEE